MIRYTLKCSEDHRFESWFRSAEAFETLKAAGQVSCPDCNSTEVEKAMMAPPVSTARKHVSVPEPQELQETQDSVPTKGAGHGAPAAAPSVQPPQPGAAEMEQAVARLRAEIEANSDYVGVEFAREARKIHEGSAPARSIYGEAKIDEAKALLEEGVPLLPLPFTPKRKMN